MKSIGLCHSSSLSVFGLHKTLLLHYPLSSHKVYNKIRIGMILKIIILIQNSLQMVSELLMEVRSLKIPPT